MYFIRKYADCWAVHDDDTGFSRPLEPEEVEKVQKEFECLQEDNLRTVYADHIYSIVVMPDNAGKK